MSDERTWTATHDRTPYENLRALMRHIDIETPTAEIIRVAAIRMPGLGPGDEQIVEAIRAAFAEEHALARAHRWVNARTEPPTITIPDDHTMPTDDGTVVAPEQVHTTIEHRLARSPRPCLDADPGSVIACTGPDGPGYQCPTCGQHRRREDAIIEAVLDVWNDRPAAIPPQTALADGGER